MHFFIPGLFWKVLLRLTMFWSHVIVKFGFSVRSVREVILNDYLSRVGKRSQEMAILFVHRPISLKV